VLDMIAQAGGSTYFSKKSKIVVLRQNGAKTSESLRLQQWRSRSAARTSSSTQRHRLGAHDEAHEESVLDLAVAVWKRRK